MEPIELQAYRIMAETGLSARELAEMDMDAYARLTNRQTLAEAAIHALEASHEASAPQAPAAPQSAPQAPESQPQGLDPDSHEYFLAWRQNRARGGEGRGIFDSVDSQSETYVNAVRAQAGRTALSTAQEAPRLEGRYVNHDQQRDTRTVAQRFSTPGNSNQF